MENFISLAKQGIFETLRIRCYAITIFSFFGTTFFGQGNCGLPSGVSCTENLPSSFTLVSTSKTFSQMVADQELLDPSVSSSTPQYLVICETVSANYQNYVFAPGSEIVFLNNQSSLEILSGAKVEFRQTYIHGCQKLWYRILVKGGGQCEFNNNCRIEDGVTAIHLEPNSVLLSTSSTFDGNYTSIYSNTPGSPNQYAVAVSMNGTTISGQKTLIEPYIPNPNDPGCTFSMPHYGLAVQNVQLITIGSTAGQSNTIRDFSFSYNCSGLVTGPFGILVRNTSLTVLNTRFLNIANGTGGRGVDFNVTPGAASKLNLTGLGKNGTPTFDNVQDGVYGLGNMDIRRCHFNNVSWGIYLTGIPAAYQVAIEQNSFENMALESIYEDNSSPIRNLKISNNDFNDNGDSEQIPDIRSGVRLFSFTPGQQATWILNNTFVNSAKQKPFYYDYRGVRIQNINGSLIESNDFTDNFGNIGLLYEGINVFNASTRFWSNTFTGAGNFATHPSTGIQVVESPSCWLNCNTADQTRTGVGFRGMNSDAARFEKNNLNTHQTGLLLRSDAIIGLQTNRHNRWLGNTSNVEALFEGRNPAIPSDLAFVQQSRFFIRHLDPSDYWPTPRLIGTTNDQGQWFMSQSGSTFGVFCINSSEPGGDDAALLTAADTKVMEGTFQSVKGYPAGVWEAKLRLYRRLIENPEMMPVSSTAEAWYLNEQSTTVGRLGNIYHGIYQLSELIQQEQDDLDGAESDYANAIADIQAIDEAISNSIGNPSTIAQLLADRSVEESELSTTTEAYQNLLTNIREVRLENAQDLMEQLGAVSTTAHYETDFKTVCNILLKTYLNDGILGEEDRQILEVIAQQCRYEGGIAVLQARASLVGEWDIEEYDDCQDYLEDRSALQENIAIVGLHPNPASNSALLYLKGEHQHGKATLRNMNGQHIQTWSFEGGSEVRLTWNDKVSNGIYLLEVVTEQNAPQTIKLIIHKD